MLRRCWSPFFRRSKQLVAHFIVPLAFVFRQWTARPTDPGLVGMRAPVALIRAISLSETKRRRPTVTVFTRPAAARRRAVCTETPHVLAAC